MKKLSPYISFGILLLVLAVLFAPDFAFAGGPNLGLEFGSNTGLGKSDVRITIARIIKVVLSVLGILTLVLILFAGFKWMTAGGDESNVDSAKMIMKNAVIGLAIVMVSYALTDFILTNLYKQTTGYDYHEEVFIP
ncbi:hypothetical protein H6758_02905 [Candidatus Nomurabacteria bacterium]|nr:hypothetical protein [Candidatus Nomurabacteria bacterium]